MRKKTGDSTSFSFRGIFKRCQNEYRKLKLKPFSLTQRHYIRKDVRPTFLFALRFRYIFEWNWFLRADSMKVIQIFCRFFRKFSNLIQSDSWRWMYSEGFYLFVAFQIYISKMFDRNNFWLIFFLFNQLIRSNWFDKMCQEFSIQLGFSARAHIYVYVCMYVDCVELVWSHKHVFACHIQSIKVLQVAHQMCDICEGCCRRQNLIFQLKVDPNDGVYLYYQKGKKTHRHLNLKCLVKRYKTRKRKE